LARPPVIDLHPDFQSPAVRARLDVILLLADALRPALQPLQQLFPADWIELVKSLNAVLIAEIGRVSVARQALNIWAQFSASIQVSQLDNRATQLLQAAEQRLHSQLTVNDHALRYLEQAHAQSLAWLHSTAQRRSLNALTKISPALLRVYYDPQGTEYCASSSRITGEIGWKLQLVEHAFYGALIPDMILEHEYLSHLVPANAFLSRGVREVWLSSALFREHRNDKANGADRLLKTELWEKFRSELARHFGFTDHEFYGPQRWDWLAMKMSFYDTATFWRLTAEMIHSGNPSSQADLIDKLLGDLARLDDEGLLAAMHVKWRNLPEFSAAVQAISN